MQLNKNWTYKEVMENIKQVRKEYILICKSFDYYHLHDKVVYREAMKKLVYSYPFNEKQKNYIWQNLNRRYFTLVKGGGKNV
jgi:hypothetical protein